MHLLHAELRMMRAILGPRPMMNIKRIPILPSSYYERDRQPITESDMHTDCINFFAKLGWKLIAHEWPAVSSWERCGRGDMVFQRGPVYLVMEAKRKKNKKVQDQALYYGAVWKLQHAHADSIVAYGIWTGKTQDILGIVPCKRSAANICWPRFIGTTNDWCD